MPDNTSNNAPAKAWGRRLEDLWLDGEEGKLHAAEWKLLKCANKGWACDVTDENNVVRSQIIRFLILGGNETYTLHEHGLKLLGADISCEDKLFDCSGINTEMDISLLNCTIAGQMNFESAKANSIILSGSRIDAFHGNEMRLSGSLVLNDNFLSRGTIDLSSATIDGNLLCNGGTFSTKDKSIHAPRLTVSGNANFGKDCRIAGQVSLQSATIGGDMTFAGGSFEGKGDCINMRNAKIAGMLVWRDVLHARGELNLAGTSCNSLNMDWKSWQRPSQIRLDNFQYDRFAELPEGCNSQFWKSWLERQPERHLTRRFRPNPYQQLAKVLDGMGHEEEARDIRIERREKQRLFSTYYEPMPKDGWARFLRHMGNFWKWVQKKIIGHGYRPGVAVIWLSAMVMLGTGIYEIAARKGVMTPTHPLIFKEAIWQKNISNTPVGKIPEACRENWVFPAKEIRASCEASVASEYSTFNSFVYSLDVAIPVVNFRMENDWAPRVVHWQTGRPDSLGWWVRAWEWFQIGAGWALSLLFVSAIGGVIRRD